MCPDGGLNEGEGPSPSDPPADVDAAAFETLVERLRERIDEALLAYA